MSRIEDFNAELASPEVFRDICASLASIGKKCMINTKEAADGEEECVEIVVVQNSMQLWVHLSSSVMFKEFRLTNPEAIELSTDTLAQAFRNEAGVASMTEVKMKITHKMNRVPSTADQSGQLAITQGHRLISFHMSNRDIDGNATKVVEQRIYAEFVPAEILPSEPVVDNIGDWADPTTSQLAQMAKICEQYKQMNEKLSITISTQGIVTLKSEASDVVATTSWKVLKAERSDASQNESLFVDDEQQEAEPREEALCTVPVKDWQNLLSTRKICRRLVIGIWHEKCMVAYGFLKQSQQSSTQDVITYYFYNQAH